MESGCDIGGIEVGSSKVVILPLMIEFILICNDAGAITRVWRSNKVTIVRRRKERLLKSRQAKTLDRSKSITKHIKIPKT